MSTNQPIKVGLLKQSELEEAGHIVRLAFGTFWDCLIRLTSWATAI
jgi:hypothetical protein